MDGSGKPSNSNVSFNILLRQPSGRAEKEKDMVRGLQMCVVLIFAFSLDYFSEVGEFDSNSCTNNL